MLQEKLEDPASQERFEGHMDLQIGSGVFFRGLQRERENFPRSREVEESIARSQEVMLQEVEKLSNQYTKKLAGIFFCRVAGNLLSKECGTH